MIITTEKEKHLYFLWKTLFYTLSTTSTNNIYSTTSTTTNNIYNI